MTRNNVAAFFLAAAIAIPAFAQSGADLYKSSKCAMCHGMDGLAASNVGKAMKIPSFKDPTVIKSTDAQIFAIIKTGKGNNMKPYAGKITDDQITLLVAYIRTLQK
jgi:mono/diheme cytochrome c family protein